MHLSSANRLSLLDLHLERGRPGTGLVVGVSFRLDLDFDLVGALLQAFLHGHLAGLLADRNLLVSADLGVCFCSLALIGELDYLGDAQFLGFFLDLIVLDCCGFRLDLQRIRGFGDCERQVLRACSPSE